VDEETEGEAEIRRIAPPKELKKARDIVAWLRKMFESEEHGEPDLKEARNRLSAYLAEDPEGRVQELIGIFREESDADILKVLSGAILRNQVVGSDPGVLKSFLEIAQGDADEFRRSEALHFLTGADGFVNEFARIAGADASPEVRAYAVEALNRYVETRTGDPAAAAAALVGIAGSDADPVVREEALKRITARDLSESDRDRLAAILQNDASLDIRRRAARALGDPLPKDSKWAMDRLEQAYAGESELKVRRTILDGLVNAGRENALAALQRVAAVEPKLADDVRDYQEILATGAIDWSRIKEMKKEREAGRNQPVEETEEPPSGEPDEQ